MDTLDTYLGVLFDGLTGLVYSPVKTIDGKWETHWYNWPNEQDRLKDHIIGTLGDVYISPAVYSERRATKDAIKKLQTVWVEFDGQEKIDFRQVPVPTAIVQTSFASHVHCYWKVDPTNQQTVEDVNRRLTNYLQADNSGWDATQLLRPPKTTNWKHNLPVVLADYSGSVFQTDAFDLVPQVKSAPVEVTELSELLDLSDVLKKRQLPLQILKMIKKETPKQGDRSSFMTRLAHELAEEELNHVEIVSVLKHVDERVGKYKDRQDQLKRLSQLADYAIIKIIAEDEVAIYSFEYILNHVEDLHWILPNWLHTHGMMIVGGAPNVGKTQFICQMAYCLSEGERFLGLLAPSKQKVMVWSLEMDVRSLKFFLSKQRNEWNKIPDILVIDEEASWSHYEDLINENNVNVVLIDSLSEIYDDTSDSAIAEAKKVLKWVRKVRRRYNIAIVLIHHTRKPGEGNKRPKNLADFIGSQDIARVTETGLMLWEDSKGLELSIVKGRFTTKGPVCMLDRNENLWYRRRDDSSKVNRPTKSNQERDTGQQETGSGHGDESDGITTREISFGFGP